MNDPILAGDTGCGVEPSAHLQSYMRNTSKINGGRSPLVAAIAMVCLSLLVVGCGGRVEQPEAIGLIHDPVPIDWEDNTNLQREIVVAAKPDAFIPTPSFQLGRDDAYLNDLARNLDVFIHDHNYPEARSTLAKMRSYLNISEQVDDTILEGHDSNGQ